MPGRGTPWRGVGQGNQDRIGSEEIEDDSLLSEDIKDGTIKEVDLDTALQAKVNSGGEANTTSNAGTGEGTLAKTKSGVDLPLKTLKQGTNITITNNADDVTIDASGGGGGTGFPDTVPFTDLLYYDDFIDITADSEFASRYSIAGGTVVIADQNVNGIATLRTGAGLGTRSYMSTSKSMGNFDSGRKMDGRARFGAVRATFSPTDVMMFVGWNSATLSGSVTTSSATFETGLGVGAWFRFDPQSDANFQAVVANATKTVIDTGVAPGTGEAGAMQELRITIVPDSPESLTGTTTWFINGVQVAQTTSNFPVGPDAGTGTFEKLVFFSSITTLDAFNEDGFLDYWYILSERKPQPIEAD